MKDILVSFEKSLKRLRQTLDQRESTLVRDASILRFEFTIELAWKSVQKVLRDEQIICQSPKSCLQEAFNLEIIDDDQDWINMLEDRNLAVHSYDEELAKSIFKRLPRYVPLFDLLLKGLKMRLK
jgi:nucleotidyltransferase substrate binding protein (TIGR01987 family)